MRVCCHLFTVFQLRPLPLTGWPPVTHKGRWAGGMGARGAWTQFMPIFSYGGFRCDRDQSDRSENLVIKYWYKLRTRPSRGPTRRVASRDGDYPSRGVTTRRVASRDGGGYPSRGAPTRRVASPGWESTRPEGRPHEAGSLPRLGVYPLRGTPRGG